MRLRSTILIGVVALIAVVVGATVVSLTIVLERNARAQLAEDLGQSREVFDEVQRYRQSLARSECHTLAEEPRLKALVGTAGVTHETVLQEAQELSKSLGVDLFLLTDNEGHLLADTTEPKATGTSLAADPIIAKALVDAEVAGFWRRGTIVYQVQARQIAFGRNVVGILVVGYKLDGRVAQAVHRQTSSHVAIEVGGQLVAVAPEVAPADVTTALASVTTGAAEPKEIHLLGGTYLALAAELPGRPTVDKQPMRYAVFQSLDAALVASQRLARIIYGIAGVAIVLAILFALTLSRRLTRPLDQLVDFAQKIAAGKLESRALVRGSVEVRELGGAMNRMASDLRTSQDVLADRTRLEGEIDIARRIQTSILPPVTEAPGLEIAARMIPASEVGGDYYDVRPAKDGCWIGVGDVAGHGLPAGLVMLMVQSAVATMTKAKEDGAPSELLAILNDIVYENVRHRMKQHEYVTFVLIRYHADGRIVFAGAHEQLVVVRKATGKCEVLDTPGTWVGAAPEIKLVTEDTAARLEAGDLLVVYTDGITEAENAAGEPFGIERICSDLEANHTKPVDEIRDRVLKAAQAWSAPNQVDDMTLVVMRYAGR